MTELNKYMYDGANYQAQCVLAYLRNNNIEESWNGHEYAAKIKVGRWENCREQGYVLSLRMSGEQLNIAFFEHRNSDEICAVRWEQITINSPTIDTAKFGDVYKDKYDVSKSVNWECFREMADWIHRELTAFWNKHAKKEAVKC